MFQKYIYLLAILSCACAFDSVDVCSKLNQDLLLQHDRDGFVMIEGRHYKITALGAEKFNLKGRELESAQDNLLRTSAEGFAPCDLTFTDQSHETVYVRLDHTRDPALIQANNDYGERLRVLVTNMEQSSQLKKDPAVICTQLTIQSLRDRQFKFAGKDFKVEYEGDVSENAKIKDPWFLYEMPHGGYACKVYVSDKELTVFIRP